ncbi:MAG: methylated-DNA--[protein]-cysteine S-methyltransferase [Pseudomonadota bacterium]
MAWIQLNSPVGRLKVIERDDAIIRVTWRVEDRACDTETTPLLTCAARQLEDYFAGREFAFDLPLRPAGSAFQRAVWSAMCRIPPGQTASYGDLADEIGNVPRAVGLACGANPIPIIIPCHRVLAAGGRMGGFSGGGGVETKRKLLEHEGALPPSLF